MIDLLISAARFDFSNIKKSRDFKVRISLLLIITLGITSISIILISQFMKTDTLSALNIIQGIEYEIDDEGISLNETELNNLNLELLSTGYSLSKDAILLHKNKLVTFNQLLVLSSQSKITSSSVKSKIRVNKRFYSNFIFYYFYFKEGLIIIWLIILPIILSRLTQKYLKQNKAFSFQQVYAWVSVLIINPLLVYTVMSLLDMRLSYRIFVFTIAYVIITFIFSRYTLNNIVIEGEKERIRKTTAY